MNELMLQNDLIKVNLDTMTVSARDLHKSLEVVSRFSRWFETNKELFTEGEDYNKCTSCTFVNNGAKRELEDYDISILMAKHLALMSRTKKGKEIRQYLIDLEKSWNTPEQIMARALKMADQTINSLKYEIEEKNNTITQQQETIAIQDNTITKQNKEIKIMKPKASYFDVVLHSPDKISTTVIAKDYGWGVNKLNNFLHEQKVQYRLGKNSPWLLYQKYANKGYTKSGTNTYKDNNGQDHSKIWTYWTQKGRLFIYKLMKDAGNLPLIEQQIDEE